MKRSPRALDQASVLPKTLVSLVQSSVLGTSRWDSYAQCAQSAVGRRPLETPPNPECYRQTIGGGGLQELLKQCWRDCCFSKKEKKKIGLFLQYEAQGLPCSRLRRCFDAFELCPIAYHSFMRSRRWRRTFPITNIASSLEFVDQTSNGCLCWSFCTVRSTKPSLNLSKGQSIESPT